MFVRDPIFRFGFQHHCTLASSLDVLSGKSTASQQVRVDLQKYVADIRKMYERDWDSKEVQRQQMGVALYFIDQLALRAGHEKDEDEADTVGCCTLKVCCP